MGDIKGMQNKINNFKMGLNKELGKVLFEEAERIMAISKEKFVPVLTGNLRSTGHVTLPVMTERGPSVVLAYGGPAAPYAVIVHEVPAYHRNGQWKYLETPLNEERRHIKNSLKVAIKRAYEGSR